MEGKKVEFTNTEKAALQLAASRVETADVASRLRRLEFDVVLERVLRNYEADGLKIQLDLEAGTFTIVE